LVIYQEFLQFTFNHSKRCRYNCRGNFFRPFFIIHSTFSQHFSVFTPLFHSRTSKFTTTTAQFPFYNCKLHFRTAEIVISCTLKYALALSIAQSIQGDFNIMASIQTVGAPISS